MRVLPISIPEGLPRALKMSDEEFLREARMLLAAKLYELGKVSAGIAAEVAGTDRLTFLGQPERYDVAAVNLKDEDVEAHLGHWLRECSVVRPDMAQLLLDLGEGERDIVRR